MAASFFPDEILETILLKLPIKSLLRFKSVSKTWNTMISDPRFIRTHYQLSMSDNLFLKYQKGWWSLMRLEGHKFEIEATARWKNCGRLCVGDGLVVFQGDNFMTYKLWNPRTQQHTTLRPYDHNLIEFRWNNLCGVCYDSKNDDVKVVIASGAFYTVFSCKTRCWAEKKEFPYPNASGSGRSMDGSVYWCYNNNSTIICFDSRDDKFKILQTPEDDENRLLLYLELRKDRLYLWGRENGRWETIKIWMKEKGGPDAATWKLLINIDNLPDPIGRGIICAVWTENEILAYLGWNKLCIYNYSDKSYKEIQESTAEPWHLRPFSDSMFSPNP